MEGGREGGGGRGGGGEGGREGGGEGGRGGKGEGGGREGGREGEGGRQVGNEGRKVVVWMQESTKVKKESVVLCCMYCTCTYACKLTYMYIKNNYSVFLYLLVW